MGGIYGVKDLKEAFDLGFAVVAAGKCSLDDGKVTLGDIVCVIPVFPKIQPGVDGIGNALKELADIDEADEKELLDYAKAKIPEVVGDEKLKKKVYAYVKAGLAVAVAISVSRE